ncbi:MAG TPA: hypothetical protein VFB00_02865 [Terriglobales bacterium]|nr:hypothetical protein [Terriglobales bacterium]
MKKHRFLLGLGLLLLGTLASAQTVDMKVNVPFDFVVGKATLPSGDYTVKSWISDGSAISIRNADKTAQSLVLANRCESTKIPENPKLVFHRYGNRYFLAQIWMAGNNSGRELSPGKQERELARSITAEQVVLAAKLD